ncbi:hypothetical protein ABTB81_19700, partial [Acinetobacter baumannii]
MSPLWIASLALAMTEGGVNYFLILASAGLIIQLIIFPHAVLVDRDGVERIDTRRLHLFEV